MKILAISIIIFVALLAWFSSPYLYREKIEQFEDALYRAVFLNDEDERQG